MSTRFSIFLFPLVFLTGTAGLVYQVVWQQYLARILGNEHAATAIILAVFLGGLAVGYLFSGHLSWRVAHPLAVYAVLEAVIGAWGLVFPFLFRAVESGTARWSFAPPWALGFEGSLTAVVLIGLPTLCMGGTVPLLTRALSASVHQSTAVHARVYAINTLGAFLGALAAGFLLVPWLGLPGTLRLAAVLNFSAALYFFLASRGRRLPGENLADKSAGARRYPVPILHLVAFLSGAYVMTLENVFIRLTDLALGTSTASFSLLVAVFVLCIGVGSLFIGRLRQLSPRALVWNQFALTLALLAVYFTLDKWPYAAHLLRVAFQSNLAGYWWHKAALLFCLTSLLALPVALAGATLPIAFHELRRDLAHVGWFSGLLFFWNLLGAVLGSLLGGWLLYHWLDHGRVFLSAVFLTAISAVLAAGKRKPLLLPALGLLLLAAGFLFFQPGYARARFAMGTFRLHTPIPETWDGAAEFYRARMAALRLVSYTDGPAATVAVIESDVPEVRLTPEGLPELFSPPAGQAKTARAIFVNGKSDSNTYADRETLRLLGGLGALFAEERRRALVIGLGTGVTAGELALDPAWEKIVAAEVAPEVAAALPLFSEATHEVEKDPRFELRLGDAFRVLRRSPEKWDVIASEPSNLWVRGTAQLFSREFYRMVRSRLTNGGVFVQWMHTYGVDDEILRRVSATLRSEFPSVAVFRGTQSDCLFVATTAPLSEAHFARAAGRLRADPRWENSLREIGITSAADLRARELHPAFLQASAAPVETLDRPALHHLASQTAFSSDFKPEIEFTPPGRVEIIDHSLVR